MMTEKTARHFRGILADIAGSGLRKTERIIAGPQGRAVTLGNGGEVVNLCSNNYLGLAAHPDVVRASIDAVRSRGFGLSSVRFICGTQDIHKKLESAVAAFIGADDAILYSSCFDANAGLFETLLGTEDAVISDELNHASIIDGIRLCRARKFVFRHADTADLERALRESSDARFRLVATDGVFSMDGDIAPLPEICDLAGKYDALVMVDDSHATGYIGRTGRGTAEHHDVRGRIDIVTTTFGKALGGASGGCAAGRKELIDILRQRSRPYLFSNTLAPGIVGGVLKSFEILEKDPGLPGKVVSAAGYFRERIISLGFAVPPGNTAIIPVMLYDEKAAQKAAEMLLEKGVYAVAFSHPVVPKGKARIRVQISAAHTREDLDLALRAFGETGRALGIIR